MMTKREKQRNFFKSIYIASEKEKIKELLDDVKYKTVKINIPLPALEEIKEWSEERENE